MDPKFQSSFIPKGPLVSTAASMAMGRKAEGRGLLAFIALTIFIISVLLALGMFGYKFYLKYRIDQMSASLETALGRIQPEPGIIRELIRFDNRIVSTKKLASEHLVLSSLFEFLEVSTPKTVRFSSFSYSMSNEGLELSMNGEARGYAALALQADIFSKSQYLKNSIFSDLNLNGKGDVNFSFKATVDPSLVSYKRQVERVGAPSVPPPAPSEELVGGELMATSTDLINLPTATSSSIQN